MTQNDDTRSFRDAPRAERLVVWGSAIWGVGFAAFALFGEQAALAPALLPWIIAVLPAIFAGLWISAARRARAFESDLSDLAARLVSLREQVEFLQEGQAQGSNASQLAEQVSQLAKAQEKTDSTLAVFLSSRGPAAEAAATQRATPSPSPSPSASVRQDILLPKDQPDPHAPLSHEDFIRAANFPRNAEDRVGFAVLRLALANDQTNAFIRSAQDILTLLSQQGIYMDDLAPEKTSAMAWRSFGAGKRGRDIAQLGAIRDRLVLDKVATRMREDIVFRDAVHHFLRKFDRVFTEFCEEASDDDLMHFAETRSARAFMLLGRIAGTFD